MRSNRQTDSRLPLAPSFSLLCLFSLLFIIAPVAIAQTETIPPGSNSIPRATHIQILQAEDERRWDETLSKMLSDSNSAIRVRSALAAGRIGNDQALAPLSSLLKDDKDENVRAMAAFAIGEIEAAGVEHEGEPLTLQEAGFKYSG